MPTEASVRAAIKAKVQGVTNIGVVHDYERYANAMNEFRTLYQADIAGVKQVRGWYIRRMTRRESSDYQGRHEVILGWRVQGFMSLDDASASEKTFDSLVETLVDAFRADETLGGAVDSSIVGEDAGLQIEDTGPVMFGGVLCHSARGRLMTRHFI